MAPKYYLVFIAILIANISTISCKQNRTLVLVIDDTQSMRTEIDIVKSESIRFMDILSQNTSQIEDVAIVTFINDPVRSTLRLAPTRNRDEFKRALNEIDTDHLTMGDDCPKYSLTGIRKALENSGNNSYLFVFTDSNPKEGYTPILNWGRRTWKLNESLQAQEVINVKEYAKSKDTQIFFFVTGKVTGSICNTSERLFQPYWDIADATNGQVFKINIKHDLKQFFHYMTALLSEESRMLARCNIYDFNGVTTVTFALDSHTQYLRVTGSTRGDNITLDISDGPVTNYETISLTNNNKVLKLKNPPVGEYSVTIRSTGEATVIMAQGPTRLANQN